MRLLTSGLRSNGNIGSRSRRYKSPPANALLGSAVLPGTQLDGCTPPPARNAPMVGAQATRSAADAALALT